jgi:hypothetical protein
MSKFEFEPEKSYVMPVHFGPMVPGWDGMTVHYERAVGLVFSGSIDRSAVSAYLPPGFTADDPAILSVRYLQLSGCIGLAGGGYNVVSVEVSAHFDGEQDHVDGDYALIQWEGHNAPAIMGRELVGSPKIVADIPDYWSFGGAKGWHVSENSTRLAEGEVSPLEKLGEARRNGCRRELSHLVFQQAERDGGLERPGQGALLRDLLREDPSEQPDQRGARKAPDPGGGGCDDGRGQPRSPDLRVAQAEVARS